MYDSIRNKTFELLDFAKSMEDEDYVVFSIEWRDDDYYNKQNGSSSSGGEKCYWCNGTGSVRYNYGSSDLEAALDGHDPYTYGTCFSCNGTGRK